MFLFAPITFITAVFTGVISIAMLVIALSQDASAIGRPQAVRHAFFSILTLVSLMASAGSIVFLTHVGFRIWVFPDAQYEQATYNYPPGLFIMTPESGMQTKIDCKAKETCPLTDSQKNDIKNWAENYKNWKARNEVSVRNRTHTINTLSVLIVALPIFFAAYTILQRAFNTMQQKSATRHVYYYGVAFTTLIIFLASIALLLNAIMNQWLLPEKKAPDSYPRPYATEEISNVENLSNCTEKCVLSEEYKDLAKQWQEDSKIFTERQSTINRYHVTYTVTLPLMIISSLLFTWHFLTIRKRNQTEIKQI